MESVKKTGFMVAGILCAIACIILIIKAIPGQKEPPVIVDPTPVTEPDKDPEPVKEPYRSPVDFKAWQERNSDVYAWLSIPGTDISYPVLHNADEDEYYLERNVDRQWASDGSLFTQASYNSKTFDDPVTIIYGHRMNSGAMFGQLQPLYLGEADFSAINKFVVFLPDKELHYQIFAAVPHSNEHILYFHDFTDKEVLQEFLDEIYAETDSAANFDESAFATADDKLVILETCLQTNRTNRFLVIGKLIETVE